ncbi:unnamed protein product, partial [Sphacelaria rigidula]
VSQVKATLNIQLQTALVLKVVRSLEAGQVLLTNQFLSTLCRSFRDSSYLRKAYISPRFPGDYTSHEALESPIFAEPLYGRDHEGKFLVFLSSVTRRRLPCFRRRVRWRRFKGRI